MTDRVKQLINHLYLTTISLEQGCLDCGFTESDLTDAENDAINESIFQCGFCGYWHEACEEEFDFTYGSLCEECAAEFDEED